jgi:hypothetical protein
MICKHKARGPDKAITDATTGIHENAMAAAMGASDRFTAFFVPPTEREEG